MAAEELAHLDSTSLASGLRRGDFSALELMDFCLRRIQRADSRLQAFIEVFTDDALREAEAVDRRLAAGGRLGPLAGVPVAIKDNLSIAGRSLSCGSRILEGYVAPYSATAVERLQRAGAIVVGRTNLDEMAMGSSCETSIWGSTLNPWDLGRVPGGSSGGSAAAVAAAMVPLALGSDTGGSVRQPAAFTGVVGLRPTYGRVSRHGLVAFASSFDQVGPLARSVRDVALALEVLAGPDPRDSTTTKEPVESWGSSLQGIEDAPSLAGLRLGWCELAGDLAVDAATEACWRRSCQRLEALGATLVPLQLPTLDQALAIYSVLAPCEASSNLARFDGVRFGRRAAEAEDLEDSAVEELSLEDLYVRSRSEGFGPEVKRRILLGTYALSAGDRESYYYRARRALRQVRRELREALERVDALISPTTPTSAFALGARREPLEMYRSDIFTCAPSLAGLPAIAVPAGLTGEGLPSSLQVTGAPFAEAKILRIATAFEADRQRDEGMLRPSMEWMNASGVAA
ncbi:MAG: Asp-tRNA(Asn)/Glu-tRNA(Gln) amidotransferase subunit GatA [Acidobacteriota bacterium]